MRVSQAKKQPVPSGSGCFSFDITANIYAASAPYLPALFWQAGLPAVLVPFPHAVHDHQTRNAQVLEKAGAALLVPEKRLRERDLGRMLPDLLNNSDVRARMSAAALAAARRSGGRAGAARFSALKLCEDESSPRNI